MSKTSHFRRLLLLCFFFIFVLAALIWRILDLTVLDRQFLQGQGDARTIRTLTIPAHRGMISDRHGIPLALSTPVKTLWVNPQTFHPDEKQWQQLRRVLPSETKRLRAQLKRNANREFIYLSRQMRPSIAKRVMDLNIPGIYVQQEYKRYYPEAASTAHVIGFTNIDDQGIEGLELVYHDWLMGIAGQRRVIKDRLGRVIDDLGIIREPRSGHNLSLSIDRRLQFIAYDALSKTLEKFGAKSGTVVVLDSRSGEVLVMANAPAYNPNLRGKYDPDVYRNRAATDLFEPGSVIKPFTIASALESGLFKEDTVINTHPSWMMVNGHVVRDGRNYGSLDLTGILQHSSNVGVTKLALASPPEQLISLLAHSGFGQRTESNYPGETAGTLVHPADANPFVHATLAFGYGLSVTALQLSQAYLIFANEGRLLPVSLLHGQKPGQAVQVIKKETANKVLQMMEAVVSNQGTGRRAKISGFRVAGKTGTSRIAGKNGYEANRHIASFVGIAPVSKPRFVVSVIVYEPSKISYYGSASAAPLFAKVMNAALHLYDIDSDAAT